MGTGDFFVLGIVAFWLVFVLVYLWKKKKAGKCIGCGGCDGSGCSKCGR